MIQKSLIDVDYTLVKKHKFCRDNWKIYSPFFKALGDMNAGTLAWT